MLNVNLSNETEQVLSDELLSKVKIYMKKTLTAEHVDFENRDVEIDFSWVTPETIRILNRDYRDNDSETDVLSFPQYSFPDEADLVFKVSDADIPLLLGDVIMNPIRAAEQGESYGTGFEREICYLTVHSVLHLLGYDHIDPEDKKIMRSREKLIMKEE